MLNLVMLSSTVLYSPIWLVLAIAAERRKFFGCYHWYHCRTLDWFCILPIDSIMATKVTIRQRLVSSLSPQ